MLSNPSLQRTALTGRGLSSNVSRYRKFRELTTSTGHVEMDITEHLVGSDSFSIEAARFLQDEREPIMYSCDIAEANARVTYILPPRSQEIRYFGAFGFNYIWPSSQKRDVLRKQVIKELLVKGGFVTARQYRMFSASNGYDFLWEFSPIGVSLRPYYVEMLQQYSGREFCRKQHIGNPEPGHPAHILFTALASGSNVDERASAIGSLLADAGMAQKLSDESPGYEYCIAGVFGFDGGGVHDIKRITDEDFKALEIAKRLFWPHFEPGLSMFPAQREMAKSEIEGKYYRGNYAPDYLERLAELEKGVVELRDALRERYRVLSYTPDEYCQGLGAVAAIHSLQDRRP